MIYIALTSGEKLGTFAAVLRRAVTAD